MSIRKRTWTNAKGEEKTAWVVDYTDTKGTRRLKTFRLKKEADVFATTASVEVREGVHVADSASATVKEAGELWIKRAEKNGLERGTIVQYRQHLDLHINHFLGTTLLSRLTVPAIRSFEDDMMEQGRSTSMVRKVMVSLGSLLADAQERGLVIRNAARKRAALVKGQGQAPREAPEGQVAYWGGYSLTGRDKGHRRRSGGQMETVASDRDIYRPTRF